MSFFIHHFFFDEGAAGETQVVIPDAIELQHDIFTGESRVIVSTIPEEMISSERERAMRTGKPFIAFCIHPTILLTLFLPFFFRGDAFKGGVRAYHIRRL
jgi:hypothetical protein